METTIERKEMIKSGSRSMLNVIAVSLLLAYASAYLLPTLVPLYILFFIPIVAIYFIAPKLNKTSPEPRNALYRNMRLGVLAIGLVVGVVGFMNGLGPILQAVNSGTTADGNSAIGVLANIMYLITLVLGYFRSK
jgi:uncharacterized membrane protein YfcA